MKMRCPECSSENVLVEPYDFGTCSQTGYLDAGERFRCLECGATGDAIDLGEPDHPARRDATRAAGVPTMGTTY